MFKRKSSSSGYTKVVSGIKTKLSGDAPPTVVRLSKKSRFFRLLFLPITNKTLRYLCLAIFLTGVVGVLYLLKDLPSPSRLTTSENYAVSSLIYDRNGELLYEIFGDENRIPVELEALPPHVYQAAIAIEDQNFYRHIGFDVQGIARAAVKNIKGERLEGGSTITQQLVKNALLSNEKSIQRKAKEALLAVMTEILYSKEEILEMYLNYISYGGTAVGVEAAAQTYFDKSAKNLTLAEAALLAGLPQAPTYYSPFGSDASRAKERQHEVLRRMVEDGYITPLEAEAAKGEVLTYAISMTDIKAPHFVFYVRDLLYEEYGTETVERGGLRVTTTLDLNLQNAAQASLSAEVKTLARMNVSNGAALVIKPDTGEILSMIGSKDYFNAADSGQVNVTLAPRQPGSSVKPLMYATAFEKKTLNPGSILIDAPTCFIVPGQKPYCPQNYDGSYKGPMTVRESLGNSLNIPAVKALKTIGVPTFIEQANAMGISSWTDPSRYGLSLTLGGGEVRMVDLAQAFGVLANQGVKVPLTPILKIETYKGELLLETDLEQRASDLAYLTENEDEPSAGDLSRIMHRAPAYMASHIMQDNKARTRAFGPRSELVIPDQIVSAKTGTTNDLKDNWTVGFTPEFLVVTWVGNNDGEEMNSRLVSGVTGAAPIFNDIMSFILQGREPVWQTKPASVLSDRVCASGMPPSKDRGCSPRVTELYWTEGQPSASKLIKQQVWIDPTTGLPPPPGVHVDGLVLEERIIYQDPVTPTYCSDCNRPTTEEGRVIYEQNSVQENQDTQTQTQTRTETVIQESSQRTQRNEEKEEKKDD